MEDCFTVPSFRLQALPTVRNGAEACVWDQHATEDEFCERRSSLPMQMYKRGESESWVSLKEPQ